MDIVYEFIAEFSYAAIALVIVGGGLGLPIPEDVPLVFGGYLLYTGTVQMVPLFAISFVAIVSADSLLFFLGRRARQASRGTGVFSRVINPKRRRRVNRFFERFGLLTIFVARYLPGVRAPAFFMAGTSRLRFSRFLLIDGLAATVSVPLWTGVGLLFGEEIETGLQMIRNVENALALVLAVAGLIVLLALVVRHRRNRLDDDDEESPAPGG